MKTRAKILETAKTLFNKHGVPQISLRDIAKEINISQGNLTYHFNKKEQIFEELYFEFVDLFENEKLVEGEANQLNFKAFLTHTLRRMEIMFAYRFLFIDLNHTLREYPKIHQHFKQLGQTNEMNYQGLFKLAVDNDIMRGPAFKDEFHGLAQRVNMFNDHWLSAVAAYEEITDIAIQKYHGLLTEMLFPYFSHKSQREYLLLQ